MPLTLQNYKKKQRLTITVGRFQFMNVKKVNLTFCYKLTHHAYSVNVSVDIKVCQT